MTKRTKPVAMDDMDAVLEAYRRFDLKSKEWAAARDELRELIEKRLGGATIGTVGGKPVVRRSAYIERRPTIAKMRERLSAAGVEHCCENYERTRFRVGGQ